MGTYLNFINNKNILLETISAKKLLNNTDIGRRNRAKRQVRTKPPIVSAENGGLERLTYSFKSFPSTEGKRHWGYLIYDPKSYLLSECWCACKDFQFNQDYLFRKNRLFNPKSLTKELAKNRSVVPKNAPPKIINPDNRLFLCKHLTALVEGYFTKGLKR